jgi:methyl-CpG-binding domain protein 4
VLLLHLASQTLRGLIYLASESDLVALLRPLGTQNVRAKRLISLSRAYLQDPPSHRDERPSRALGAPISPRKRKKYPPTPISHLPGAGAYALDSYRIFCMGPGSEEWKEVNPSDKELIRYLVSAAYLRRQPLNASAEMEVGCDRE